MSTEERLEVLERQNKTLLEKIDILLSQKRINTTWVSEDEALELLGCKRAKLFQLKSSGEIRYKRVGRGNYYSRHSIDKYNDKYSS